jgi:hypothetical protein
MADPLAKREVCGLATGGCKPRVDCSRQIALPTIAEHLNSKVKISFVNSLSVRIIEKIPTKSALRSTDKFNNPRENIDAESPTLDPDCRCLIRRL